MLENGNGMVMPVAPTGNGGFGGFGQDGLWILLLLLICGGGWGMGGFGYGGGIGGLAADGAMLYPWMNQSQQINDGFRDQMINGAINGIQSSITTGFGDVQNSLCAGFAGVNASINGAQNAISQQMYTNQISDLERSFAAQTANTAALTGIQAQIAQNSNATNTGIADLKYTVATENCADRTAAAQNTRDIIDAQVNGTRAILDKLCQLELDGVKAQVDAKNDRISELQTQLNMASLRESQTAQNAFIAQGFANEVDQLYNRLNTCPVPSTPVYGRTPIFSCGSNNTGCGCGCGMVA